jgi:hypothetical protein
LGRSERFGFTLLGLGLSSVGTRGLGFEAQARLSINGIADASNGLGLGVFLLCEAPLVAPPDPLSVAIPLRFGVEQFLGNTPEVFEDVSWPMQQTSIAADVGLALSWSGGFSARGLIGTAMPISTSSGDYPAKGERSLTDPMVRLQLDFGYRF